MADRTINININITGSTTGTTGKGSSGGSSSIIQQKEEAKRLTIQLKEEEKRRTLDHAAELKKQSEASKRAYKEQTAAAKKAAKEETDAVKKATSSNSNTWANAIKSYQFKFNALGNIISTVVSTSIRMLAQLGSSVVTISKDFEFAMSGVKAITMATDEQFQSLTNDAIRLGGETIYTATDIAKLQEELAKLGFTTEEIRVATDGVVALAAATGEDLGDSALVAGTVIRGFGLQASELTRIVDIMSQSFNTSALDLDKFSETMKYVAPIASKVGFSVEETTTLMAKLADQGIVASQAGTGLRNIMLRLADSHSKLSKAMGGPVKSLPELIIGLQKLKDKGIDATGALKLVDRYSVTAFMGLIQASDKLKGVYDTLSDSYGISQKMADIRMDNFAGSVEKLSGEWQSFILTVNKSNGILRGAVDVIRSMVGGLTKIFQSYETAALIASNKDLLEYRKTIDSKIIENNKLYKNQMDLIQKEYEESISKGENEKKAREKLSDKLADLRKKQKQDVVNITKSELESKLKILEEELPALKKHQEEVLAITGINPYLTPSDYAARDEAAAKIKAKEEEIKSINALLTQNSAEQLAIYSDSNDSIYADMEEASKEEIRLAKEKEKNRLELLREGLNKEIAIIESNFKDQKEQAIKSGNWNAENAKNWELNKQDAINKVIKEYKEKALDVETEYYKTIAEISLDEKELKEYNARITYFERKKWIDENIKDEKKRAELIKENEDKLAKAGIMQPLKTKQSEPKKKLAKSSVFKSSISDYAYDELSIWDKLGIEPFTSDQINAMKKGFSYLSDELQKIADKEKEIADQRVENAKTVVDQLEQELQTEISLAEAGYASNVTLKQKELTEAKKQQEEALKIQEEALKKQQKLESASQLADLLSASASILKGSFKEGPILGMILSGAALAAMWGSWIAAKTQAASLTAYGDGGEINGPKHSRGGVPIVAEGGEYVIRADAYAKNKELVQAINNEDMSSVYRSLNQDLSVSLDDSNTARMLGRHFKDKKEVVYHDKCRIETIGNRRRVIRYA